MDKRSNSSHRMAILNIKTGINLYRAFAFVLFSLTLMITIFFVIFNRNMMEITISVIINCLLILILIFMDKIVYIFKFPTNHLIVSNNEIIYKKRNMQFVYKTCETNLKFHSFFEDMESISLLHISSKENEHYISITKKQYKLIMMFLENNV